MSDPANPYSAAPSTGQPPYGQQQPQGQQGAYGQPVYGQPVYVLNPAVEKIRSNASTVRILSFLSFLFGGVILSACMWVWANKMVSEAQSLGAPADVTTEVQGARSTAKIVTFVHIAVVVAVILFMVLIVIMAILADPNI